MTDFNSPAPIPLTIRQRQVVALAAAGHPNTTIARTLQIGVNTVKRHLKLAMQRLGARNRAHAVAQAFRAGELT